MNLQDISMIQNAKEQVEIVTGLDEKDGLWYGSVLVNHPTPSGSERWMRVISLATGADTEEGARNTLQSGIDAARGFDVKAYLCEQQKQ